jgi:predicted DCC family thiol-disulfide oxidoreductase YuxK
VRHPVLFYDGVCGLCNRVVRFVLKRDRQAVFRFVALQSALGKTILARFGVDSSDLDSMYVLTDYHSEKLDREDQTDDGDLLARSDAVLFVAGELGGIWRVLGKMVRWWPRVVREGAYRFVARHRYQMFGRYDTCPLPSEETRARFLDP